MEEKEEDRGGEGTKTSMRMMTAMGMMTAMRMMNAMRMMTAMEMRKRKPGSPSKEGVE